MNDGLNCKRQQTYNLDWRLQVWHWELVSCGRAVDGDKQAEQLEQLHDVLRTQYPSYIYRKSTHLRHCNVPIHASIVARENSRNCRKLKLYPTYPTAQILQPQIIFFSDRWHTSSVGGNSLEEVEVDVETSWPPSILSGTTTTDSSHWLRDGRKLSKLIDCFPRMKLCLYIICTSLNVSLQFAAKGRLLYFIKPQKRDEVLIHLDTTTCR